MTDAAHSLQDRPLVTFALFAYNQEKYIREAVEGAFAQTYEPLEIILSDDRSSDRTFEIMQEMAAEYAGPHEVRVRRNEVNLGVVSHVNKVVGESRGEFIVMSAGDDISLAERTMRSIQPMLLRSKLCFVEVGYKEFRGVDRDRLLPSMYNETGPISLLEKISGLAPNTKGAVRAFRVKSARRFPPLDSSCPTEDTPMLMRFLYLGEGLKIDFLGCLLRKHEDNLSLAENFKDGHWQHLISQVRADLQYAVEKKFVDPEISDKVLEHFHFRMTMSQASEYLNSKSLSLKTKVTYIWGNQLRIRSQERLKLLKFVVWLSLKGVVQKIVKLARVK